MNRGIKIIVTLLILLVYDRGFEFCSLTFLCDAFIFFLETYRESGTVIGHNDYYTQYAYSYE